MDAETLTEYLEDRFPGSELRNVEPVVGGTRLTGLLVWDGFADMEHLDRQNLLWDALEEHFLPEEAREISMILAFTAEEVDAILSNP